MKKVETAVLGGGCFWCTEAVFQRLKGVLKVTPGYSGGKIENPSYYEVVEKDTGHAEVIQIEFNPDIISYNDLLDAFWQVHNPTSLNRQGNDVGTQYRSVILYTSNAQKLEAEDSLKKLKESGQYEGQIVTEIRPLVKFFKAEDYHKNYYNRNKEEPYCQIVINPKLEKLKQKFSNLISAE
ncbi:peptide-methionine (S)-S-oxide reductase MsrA [Candidatus Roizmanbacteria bacterium]|nr:peptide-methionine (S)-S-oxide reductase MsrA [Candidatus Roizmanbacteria bacterium]